MKKQSITKKILRWGLLLITFIVISFAALIWFSPYKVYAGNNRKMVCNAVIINRPSDCVFKFLGNSTCTQTWISYVDHIKLTGANKNRYYCNADETGQKFDGIVLDVKINRKRKLLLCNFSDFPFEPGRLIHEQYYIPLPGNRCKLWFTLYYANEKTGFMDDFKAYVAAYRVKQAFNENMNTIKAVLEEKPVKKF